MIAIPCIKMGLYGKKCNISEVKTQSKSIFKKHPSIPNNNLKVLFQAWSANSSQEKINVKRALMRGVKFLIYCGDIHLVHYAWYSVNILTF